MRRSIKFGIFGLGRGGSFYSSILSNDGDIVAVCDLSQEKLDGAKKALGNGVALVRAAEKSSAFFMIAGNYPFMKFNLTKTSKNNEMLGINIWRGAVFFLHLAFLVAI